MKIKIKKINLGLFFVYLFDLFLIMKLIRAFSKSTQAGGVWNIIQMWFIISGFFLFLKYYRMLIQNKCILYLGLYSVFAFLLSIFSLDGLSVSLIFELSKTIYPAAVIIIFYYAGLKKIEIRKDINSIKYAFLIASCILIFTLAQYMISGGGRASGAGAVADIYYILGLLPLLLVIIDYEKWFLPIIVTGVGIVFSQKRAALIAYLFVIVLSYGLQVRKNKDYMSLIKKIAGIILIIIIGYMIFQYLDTEFHLEIWERLQNLREDGGSGRDVRWNTIWEAIKNSSLLQIIKGHGMRSIVNDIGGNAHNDFLQIWYEYGIVALLLYILFFLQLLFTAYKMYRMKYPYTVQFICSLIITLFIAGVSFYVIDNTYITTGCMVQGVLMADFKKYLDKQEDILYETY